MRRVNGGEPVLNNIRDRFRRFMVGRYGTDELNRFLLTMILVMILCNIFLRSSFLVWAQLILLILSYLRMFSKNTSRRFRENQSFLNLRFQTGERLKNIKPRFEEARKYKIFKCPDCGQKLRIPRGHGKISIHCRKCGCDFMGKS